MQKINILFIITILSCNSIIAMKSKKRPATCLNTIDCLQTIDRLQTIYCLHTIYCLKKIETRFKTINKPLFNNLKKAMEDTKNYSIKKAIEDIKKKAMEDNKNLNTKKLYNNNISFSINKKEAEYAMHKERMRRINICKSRATKIEDAEQKKLSIQYIQIFSEALEKAHIDYINKFVNGARKATKKELRNIIDFRVSRSHSLGSTRKIQTQSIEIRLI